MLCSPGGNPHAPKNIPFLFFTTYQSSTICQNLRLFTILQPVATHTPVLHPVANARPSQTLSYADPKACLQPHLWQEASTRGVILHPASSSIPKPSGNSPLLQPPITHVTLQQARKEQCETKHLVYNHIRLCITSLASMPPFCLNGPPRCTTRRVWAHHWGGRR